MKRRSSITVIGGGVAGVGTALALARAGYGVRLIERGKLLSATSNSTPGRLGLGFHYATSDTAAMLFDTSMDLVRRFPGCTLGRELPLGHPLRRGQYFIARDSLFGVDEIFAVHAMLEDRYTKAWSAANGQLPFGPPSSFRKVLKEDGYRQYVNVEKVAAGVDTAETLLDWGEVRRRLQIAICSQPLIEVVEHEEVVAIDRHDAFDFSIATRRQDGEHMTYRAQMIVNCTWQNIDRINRMAGLSDHVGSTNRLKALLEVRLTEQLVNRSSMFFCMGPFAMFANMNNGRGMMTYAPTTNIHSFDAGDELGEGAINAALRGEVSESERSRIALAMQEGVSTFIPDIRGAGPLGLKFGVVRTHGSCELWDKQSDMHHRDYDGIREEAEDFITNASMKLVYFARNADQVAALVGERLRGEKNALPSRKRFGTEPVSPVMSVTA